LIPGATTRVDIIDRSLEKAHIWINDVAEELGIEDSHRAYRGATSSV
jgi:uncharacterized protein (DUF2267 family)